MQHSWVHMRRDFITVAHERDDQEEWAEQWLADIATLYHLNDERLEVRDEPAQYAAADAALRAGVQAMQERRERELAQQPKLPAACAKVLRSLRNHWDGLTLFVEDPNLPMDNNQAERALRGPVVGRKNYYGSGAQWSGELSAALFSLFHTLERWRINPRTWLTEYLTPVRTPAVGCLRTSSGSCPGTVARRDRRAPRPPRWSTIVSPEAVRYCGRLFSEQEMRLIRAIIAEDPNRHRFALSQVVCERLHWRRANGQLKDMSCRVAMLRMHRDGLIPLPAPRRRHYNGTLHRRRTPQAEPELPIIARVDALPALQVRPLADQREAQLWREYVDRYHYLGYTPLPGAQMRYLVTSQRRVLAVVGFGASAWKAAPRDRFIGWSVAQREARLQLVVNNARFLILPWVQVRNLASTVLARSSRRLPDDWQARYGYRPLLLETFVQSDRFAGTSYRAANWTHVGQTQGRGKLDVHKTYALPRKDIWLYPLRRDFRRRLCAPLNPPPHR